MIVVDPVSENSKNKYAPYERMATAIVKITKENGGCLPHNLLEKGFTRQETVDLWHMAQAMAEIELKLMAA